MKKKIFILIMMLFGSVCLFNVKCFAKIAPDIEPDVDPYFTSLLNTNLYHTSGEKVISSGGINYGYFYYDYYIEKLGTYNDGYSDYGIFQYNINASFVPGAVANGELEFYRPSYINDCLVECSFFPYTKDGLFGSISPNVPVEIKTWPHSNMNEDPLGTITISTGHKKEVSIGATMDFGGNIPKENSKANLTGKAEAKFGINGKYTFTTTYSREYSISCPQLTTVKPQGLNGFSMYYSSFMEYNKCALHTSCGGIYEIQKNNNGYYSFKSNIKIESDFMYHKQNVICTNNVVFK